MEANNTHTRFSVEIERRDKRTFDFLVPNHLVNKIGIISKW